MSTATTAAPRRHARADRPPVPDALQALFDAAWASSPHSTGTTQWGVFADALDEFAHEARHDRFYQGAAPALLVNAPAVADAVRRNAAFARSAPDGRLALVCHTARGTLTTGPVFRRPPEPPARPAAADDAGRLDDGGQELTLRAVLMLVDAALDLTDPLDEYADVWHFLSHARLLLEGGTLHFHGRRDAADLGDAALAQQLARTPAWARPASAADLFPSEDAR